jgi:hypothetical protein
MLKVKHIKRKLNNISFLEHLGEMIANILILSIVPPFLKRKVGVLGVAGSRVGVV